MLQSELKKVFEGSTIEVNLIKSALEEVNIEPIIKDRSESGQLAGFAGEIPMEAEVFVFNDQYDKAIKIIKSLDLEK